MSILDYLVFGFFWGIVGGVIAAICIGFKRACVWGIKRFKLKLRRRADVRVMRGKK